MKQTIDGLEPKFDLRIRAQTRITVKQRVDERRPSLITKGDCRRYTKHYASCRCTAEGAPVPRSQERDREEKPKLGFVGQEAEGNSRDPRPPLHECEREPDERCGQKPVLPNSDILTHCRRRDRRDQRRRARY